MNPNVLHTTCAHRGVFTGYSLQEVPGDLTAVFESALTTQAKSEDGPKHDAQSPLQPSNSHTSLHVSYSEPISSSKHEPSFPEV